MPKNVIDEVTDGGVITNDGVHISFQELSSILRELNEPEVRRAVWPNVTPQYEVDSLLDRAAYILSLAK